MNTLTLNELLELDGLLADEYETDTSLYSQGPRALDYEPNLDDYEYQQSTQY